MDSSKGYGEHDRGNAGRVFAVVQATPSGRAGPVPPQLVEGSSGLPLHRFGTLPLLSKPSAGRKRLADLVRGVLGLITLRPLLIAVVIGILHPAARRVRRQDLPADKISDRVRRSVRYRQRPASSASIWRYACSPTAGAPPRAMISALVRALPRAEATRLSAQPGRLPQNAYFLAVQERPTERGTFASNPNDSVTGATVDALQAFCELSRMPEQYGTGRCAQRATAAVSTYVTNPRNDGTGPGND